MGTKFGRQQPGMGMTFGRGAAEQSLNLSSPRSAAIIAGGRAVRVALMNTHSSLAKATSARHLPAARTATSVRAVAGRISSASTPPFAFIQHSDCGEGWIPGSNICVHTATHCAAHCQTTADCGYFAHHDTAECRANAPNCALYTVAGGCSKGGNQNSSAYTVGFPPNPLYSLPGWADEQPATNAGAVQKQRLVGLRLSGGGDAPARAGGGGTLGAEVADSTDDAHVTTATPETDTRKLCDIVSVTTPRLSAPAAPHAIPRLVHFTGKSFKSAAQLNSSVDNPMIQRSIAHNPGYEFVYWHQGGCDCLMNARFPQFVSAYETLAIGTAKGDVCRYMFLYLYGGFYHDTDDEVVKPFDTLLAEIAGSQFVVGNHKQVHQRYFAFAPRHPLMLRTIKESVRRLCAKEPNIFYATGPDLFSNAFFTWAFANTTMRPSYYGGAAHPPPGASLAELEAVATKLGRFSEQRSGLRKFRGHNKPDGTTRAYHVTTRGQPTPNLYREASDCYDREAFVLADTGTCPSACAAITTAGNCQAAAVALQRQITALTGKAAPRAPTPDGPCGLDPHTTAGNASAAVPGTRCGCDPGYAATDVLNLACGGALPKRDGCSTVKECGYPTQCAATGSPCRCTRRLWVHPVPSVDESPVSAGAPSCQAKLSPAAPHDDDDDSIRPTVFFGRAATPVQESGGAVMCILRQLLVVTAADVS